MTEDIEFTDPNGNTAQPSESGTVIPETDRSITDHDIARYLLQYLLDCRGICHENMLLVVLGKLQKYTQDPTSQVCSTDKLVEIIKGINVKLNPLGYKISSVGHGMGKNNVSSMLKDTGLPSNNRFYVYVNTVTSEESKLATRFSTREIEFIKWCVEKMCVSRDCEVIIDCPIITEVDRIRNDVSWNKCITYSVESSEFFQYKDWSPIEIESLLFKLCGLKWFAKDENGRISMDLRCSVELEEYLIANGISTCENCHRLALQGTRCTSCSRSWHVDCYQHRITHIGKYCPCGESILQNGMYIV
ncbi:hypothetical protein ZYGR_0A04900 [Zygosaccharomyces rouxii]|uniref:Non-structural maintenance of chromosomes element 1 homolog n=1 Tax=Zygosaccharomyces rouxii TaxID=4956 RepID=A0A1Q2ZTQ0_ZYGRO|nr:hypothetical protein ZYGR_0A04900 [Zygosaccharomyces rouxii]